MDLDLDPSLFIDLNLDLPQGEEICRLTVHSVLPTPTTAWGEGHPLLSNNVHIIKYVLKLVENNLHFPSRTGSGFLLIGTGGCSTVKSYGASISSFPLQDQNKNPQVSSESEYRRRTHMKITKENKPEGGRSITGSKKDKKTWHKFHF